MDTTNCIERAALGRALCLGMLYDCRSDSFIPGITLWDSASLSQNLDEHEQYSTKKDFSASDSLSGTTKLLDVSASLKASFFGGLVEVGGSAKYLNDKKSSANKSRIIIQYGQTTKIKHLTMSQLGKITYPEVFEQKTATHVVTSVLYGNQVFMVFDRTKAENENKQEVEGTLNVMVKKIIMEGEGAVKMNEYEKKLAESISCKFYGDCVLKENPTTYMEALELYKKLPTLLKEEKAVPVRVWLYPLTQLNNKAAKMEREISDTVVSKIENVLEELEDAKNKYSDMDRSDAANRFQDVRERLRKFQNVFSDYERLFKKALRRILPAIRGEKKGSEKDLTDTLDIHSRSPFEATKLNKWLENVQGEIKLLNNYTALLSGVQVITSSAELNNILRDPMVDTVVCFSFTSLKYIDPYLSSITEFLKVEEFENLNVIPESRDQGIQAWFNNPEISEKMKSNMFLFRSFFEVNKKNEKTRFVIAPVSDSFNPGASIQLYRKGKMVDSNFQPVSKPPKPSVNIQNRDVTLKLQKSPTGETIRYRVEYRATQPGDSGADSENWEFTETTDAQETFTLTGLDLANQYQVRYRAVSEVGMSEASDPVFCSFQGKAVVPFGQSWDFSTASLFAGLYKKTMTYSSRWSPSTIQSEVSNQVSNITSPYVGKIPGQLKPGTALFFQGVVHPNATEFVINHKAGPEDKSDIIFHLNPRFSENRVALDNFRNGKWEMGEFTSLPLYRGSAFDLIIVIEKEGYDLYLNGIKLGFFKHRMQVDKVTTLQINGDVFMNTIGFLQDWSRSTFSKKMNVGNMISDPARLIYQPGQSYVAPISGGVRPGLALLFQGVVSLNANSFEINLMAGPRDGDDVLFHNKSSVEPPYVAQNTRKNGYWESSQKKSESPFQKGGSFEILIVVKQDAYEVLVNGHVNCTFSHRMPVDRVSTLSIWGDVFIHTFRIIEVENVYLKVSNPALV